MFITSILCKGLYSSHCPVSLGLARNIAIVARLKAVLKVGLFGALAMMHQAIRVWIQGLWVVGSLAVQGSG